MDKTNDFQLFMANKSDICVAQFVGNLGECSWHEIEQSIESIKKNPPQLFIFNFRDLADIEEKAFPLITQLQNSIREMGASIRITGVKPKLKTSLISKKIIIEDEIENNVESAIKNWLTVISMAA